MLIFGRVICDIVNIGGLTGLEDYFSPFISVTNMSSNTCVVSFAQNSGGLALFHHQDHGAPDCGYCALVMIEGCFQ